MEQSQVELSCNIFTYLPSIKTLNDFSLFLSDVGIGNRWDLDSPADTGTGTEITEDDEKGLADDSTLGEASAVLVRSPALALKQGNSRGGAKSLPSGDRGTAPLLTTEAASRKAIVGTLHPYLNLSHPEKVTSFPATSIHTPNTLKEQSNNLTRLTEPVSAFSAWLLESATVRTTKQVTTADNSAGKGKEAVVNSTKPSVAALTQDAKSLSPRQSKAGFLRLEPDEHGQNGSTVPIHRARENLYTSLSRDLTTLHHNNATVPTSEVNEINLQNGTQEFNTAVTQPTTFGENAATRDYNATQGAIYSNKTLKNESATIESVLGLLNSTSSEGLAIDQNDRKTTTSLSGLLVPPEPTSPANGTVSGTVAWDPAQNIPSQSPSSSYPDQVEKEKEQSRKNGLGFTQSSSDSGTTGVRNVVIVVGQVWVNSTHNDTTLSISLANSTDQLSLLTNTSQLPSNHSKQDKQSLLDQEYNVGDTAFTTPTTSPFQYSTRNESNESLSISSGLESFTTEAMGKTSVSLDTTINCEGLLCLDIYGETAYNFSDVNVTDYDVLGAGDKEDAVTRVWEVLLLLVIVAAGITGNVLVVIAVVIEKKLQNVTNYFLVSLAVADCLVSLIVMPCSIVHELMGKLFLFFYILIFLSSYHTDFGSNMSGSKTSCLVKGS